MRLRGSAGGTATGACGPVPAASLPSGTVRRHVLSGAAITALALAYFQRQVPETKNRSLQDIERVFLGSLATANRLAPPGRRGQVVSAYFVLCYCGLIIPVVGVGVASGFIGDFRAVLAFSILLAALCLFALAGIWRALSPSGRPQAPGTNDAFRFSIENCSHSGGGEAACPPGLKARVSTPRS